jgi:hypothetical protein
VRGLRNWIFVSYHGAVYVKYEYWRWVRPIFPAGVDFWWGRDYLVFREARVIDFQPALVHVGECTLYGVPRDGRWGKPQVAVHGDAIEFMLSYLFLLPLFLLLPVWQASTCLRRRRRSKSSKCTTCGYDLRASKDRCAECGTLIPLATEATA